MLPLSTHIRGDRTRPTHGSRPPSPALLCVAGALGAVLVLSASTLAMADPTAHDARTLNGTATAHLHLVRPEGSELIETGPVTGGLAGTAQAQLHTGSIFTGTFTIHTHGGTITGHGTAKPHGTARYQSFSGTFTATSGTGRYAHVSGHGGLYGVFDRRTDAVVMQTTGTLEY